MFYSPGVDSVALATKGLDLDHPPLSEGIYNCMAGCMLEKVHHSLHVFYTIWIGFKDQS